jgi:hypothetical protein
VDSVDSVIRKSKKQKSGEIADQVRVVILAGLLLSLLKYALPLAKLLLLLLLRSKCKVHRTACSWCCPSAVAPAAATPSFVTEYAAWPTRCRF